jgi:hypothetical protein
MNLTLEQTEKLFLEEDMSFQSMGFSLLLTNLKKFHKMSPKLYPLEDCNAEINKFISKFGASMPEDCELIAKL